LTQESRAEDILARLEHEGIKLGHERMLSLLAALGDPQLRLPSVLVAGTNGKGSVSSLLAQIARGAGYRVGLYTSPHLESPAERIRVDGEDIADEALAAGLERLLATGERLGLERPTYFEALTLVAFLHFAERRVDLAVLEVGLGGRLDATNILDADVGVVCSIGMDHVDWLGSTLEQIGREKAGIFRAGRPAVLGNPNLPRSVYAEIERVGARAVLIGRDFQMLMYPDPTAPRWNFTAGTVELNDLPMPQMRGPHQVMNAATALAAILAGDLGLTLDRDRVSDALRTARVSGRFQIVPGDVEWILDVAHNVPAAQVLSRNLKALPRRRTLAVCGILADKDVAGIATALARDVDVWIPVTLAGPRALPPDELARRLPPDATVDDHAGDVMSACRRARALANPGDRVLVFGSFLTVGPALEFLGI